MFEKSIFIYTRDLRINDNTGLLEACKDSKVVIPIFIFNPDQVTEINKYKSNNCVQFMCECLDELNDQLKEFNSKLFVFYDKPEKAIKKILKQDNQINAVYMNYDYSPFAKKRETLILNVCKKLNVTFKTFEDYMITGKDIIKNSSNNPYMRFTPYYNESIKLRVRKPIEHIPTNFISAEKKFANEYKKNYHSFYNYNVFISVHGGRSEALHILSNANVFKKYDKIRNYPSINTTKLSAYLKFNVVSIREVYYAFKNKNKEFIKQLYWRDFYMNILNHFPYVIGNSLKEKYDDIEWSYDKKIFKKWCDGMTGFPIVDAGMRELNMTGFMHNRSRMIAASFLVKVLHIDWRMGEKYFAKKLVDYDPANNNGGWQWVAGCGADSQPYFRIFNPILQAKEYDFNCEYIKHWIPELENIMPKNIHNDNFGNSDYPEKIVNYSDEKQKTLEMYNKIFN